MSCRPVLVSLLAGSSLLLIPSVAGAWNSEGHALIGHIAEQLLTPKARDRVAAILGPGIRRLQVAAPWADCVRGVKPVDGKLDYRPSSAFPECRVFETAVEEASMVNYAERNWMRCRPSPALATAAQPCLNEYHYANVPIGRKHYDSRDLAGSNDHDIVHSVGASAAFLGGEGTIAPFSFKDRREALLLLTHFVGDLHQPLHVGAAYLDGNGTLVDPPENARADPETFTTGGNAITAGLQADAENLHHAWDRIPEEDELSRIGIEKLDELVRAARKIGLPTAAMDRWPTIWADDTLLAARQAWGGLRFGRKVAGENKPGQKNQARRWPYQPKPGVHYEALRARLQEQQIVKAGAHLAQVLNAVFDPNASR